MIFKNILKVFNVYAFLIWQVNMDKIVSYLKSDIPPGAGAMQQKIMCDLTIAGLCVYSEVRPCDFVPTFTFELVAAAACMSGCRLFLGTSESKVLLNSEKLCGDYDN